MKSMRDIMRIVTESAAPEKAPKVVDARPAKKKSKPFSAPVKVKENARTRAKAPIKENGGVWDGDARAIQAHIKAGGDVQIVRNDANVQAFRQWLKGQPQYADVAAAFDAKLGAL